MQSSDFPYVVNNTGSLGLDEIGQRIREKKSETEQVLQDCGVMLFRGFPVKSPENFDVFTRNFDFEDFTYEESLSNAVRVNLTPRVFTANEAPPDTEIFLHHEMAQTPIYPRRLFFCCLSTPESGGATPVCRSDRVFADLKSKHPEVAAQFENLGLIYTIRMPGEADLASGQGRSWKNTLSVTSKDAAETKLKGLDYSWVWYEDSLLAHTPVLAAVKQLEDGSKSFFNQVIAVSQGWQKTDEPNLTFGDGSPISDKTIELILDLAARHTVPLQWQEGDVALIDNHRVMHGRYPFSGDKPRQVLASLTR